MFPYIVIIANCNMRENRGGVPRHPCRYDNSSSCRGFFQLFTTRHLWRPIKKQLTCLFVESGYPRFRLSPPLLHYAYATSCFGESLKTCLSSFFNAPYVPQRLRRRYYPSRTVVTIASFVLAICTALDKKDNKSE